MPTGISLVHAEGLRRLREQALSGRPLKLGPTEGPRAFQEHKLLAMAIQRVTLLDKLKNDSETNTWVRYFERCFPAGRNDPADARLLFGEWRTSLIKDGAPGSMVVVTHNRPDLHWVRDDPGRLCIDLESMWSDFEYSVDRFIEYLRNHPDRRAIALDRARKGMWAVEEFVPAGTGWVGTVMNVNASAASSVSVIVPPDTFKL